MNHRAHPGQPHYESPRRAPALTRNDIFQRCTTANLRHHRRAIILDFHVNETPMGQTATVSAPPTLRIRALGTDVISSVEIASLSVGG